MIMSSLQVVTLSDRTPVEPGSCRYWLPAAWTPGPRGNVIIVAPVSRDNLQGTGPEAYGTVQVIADDGVRLVSTVELGVLVVPAQ
jgi:hypothetical protein